MHVRSFAGGALVLAAVAGPGRAALPPDPLTRNAALQYWQAFAARPGPVGAPGGLTAEEQKRVEDWETAPLDEVAGTALGKYATALAYLHRGAALPRCAWATESDFPRDGVRVRTPQLGRARELRNAVLLRARYRFARGQGRRAVDDVLALVRFARHLETGSTLLGVVAAYGIERNAIQVVGDHLWAFSADPDALAAARTGWGKLPPARPMADALMAEREGMVDVLRLSAAVDPADPPDDELLPAIGFIPTLGFLLGEETGEQAVETLCGTVGRHYERLIRATAVAPEKIRAAEERYFDNWEQDTAGDDPVAVAAARLLLPAAGRLRLSELEMRARRAMLRAALAVVTRGPDEFKKHPDPFGGGPFGASAVPGGSELRSALGSVIGRPVVLIVRTTRPEE